MKTKTYDLQLNSHGSLAMALGRSCRDHRVRETLHALAAVTVILAAVSSASADEIGAVSAPVAAPAAPTAESRRAAPERIIIGAYEFRTAAGLPRSVKSLMAEGNAAHAAGWAEESARLEQNNQEARAAAEALGLHSARLSGGGWVGTPVLNGGGAPLFIKSFNKASATLIKTNAVWPAAAGGTVPPGLTGIGRTLLMWDGGSEGIPLASHPEFQLGGSSRITIASGSVPEPHATAVAGTLAGAGLVTVDVPAGEARGMAFETNVLANDQENDIAEISAQTLTQLKDRRVSNHSYGLDHGWTYAITDISGSPDIYLMWEGDLALSQAEANYYGLYTDRARTTDQQSYAKPYFQTVWAAGNQRREGPNLSLPVLVLPGYPGVFYATIRNGVFGWTNAGTFGVTSAVFRQQLPGGTFGPAISVGNILPPVDGGAAGFDTLGDVGVAKNALTVGSVDGARTLSSVATSTAHGPTDDGRLKPEVVAKGVDIFTTEDSGSYTTASGTSFASPAVAGSAHLVSFRHEDLWGNKEPMRASTLRALIAHTADDVSVISADPALVIEAGPDYKTGWGTMDTAEAVTVVNGNHAAVYNGAPMRPFIKEVFLPDGGEIDFTVKATGGKPVKVAAAWTDPAGDAQANNLLDPGASRLINDLDLTVTRTLSGGSTQLFKPWRLNPASPAAAASRTYADSNMNSADNLEIVETTTNATALQFHRIRIKQKAGTTIREVDPSTGNLVTGGQWVSITLSGIDVTNINFAITAQSFAFSGGNVQATLTWNAVVGEIYRIQRSTNLVTWTDNSGDIIPLTSSVTATSQPAPASPSGFYRIATVAPNPFNL